MRKKNLLREENGSVLIIAALAMTVFMGMSALAIDFGRAYLEKSKLQNAIDAASLAAVQELPLSTEQAEEKAREYFVKNGFEEAQIDSIGFSNSNRKIRITAHESVGYIFAKLLFPEDNVTLNSAAAAEITPPIRNCDYAVFSESELDLLQFTGSKTTITGDVHSNEDIKGQAAVNGEATASGVFQDNKLTATEGTKSGADHEIMPAFSDELEDMAQENGTYYNGDQTFSADQINVAFSKGGVIYVNGNFTVTGSGVCINAGSICATGNITFDGSKVTLQGSSPICLYSVNGNVTFDGSKAALYGIIYAPNGTATFNGQGGNIYGRVYGNVVNFNGAVNVVASTKDFDSIPVHDYKLVE